MNRRRRNRRGAVPLALAGGRRRRTPLGPLLITVVALLVAATVAVGLGRGFGGATPPPLQHVRGYLNTAPRSPAGYPLGEPPFHLSGLGNPAADALAPTFINPPDGGLLFNLETGQVLWQHNPSAKRPIASLTKMMTALVTIHRLSLQAPVLITKEAVEMPGSKVGVLPLGKRMTAEALLYGLLLPSGNDAAQALAAAAGPGVPAFVREMNEEAARLGLGATRFSNPSGYYNEGNYSCAADLAELAWVVLHQPTLAKIVATKEVAVAAPTASGKIYLYNNNPLLLYNYPGTDGVKTGYTEAAGTSLVGSARRGGVWLGVVLLHSPAPGTQAQRLLNEAFIKVYHQHLPPEAAIPGGA